MEFYGIECKGEFNLQKVDELPSFDSSRDEGRLVYNTQDGKLYVGNDVDGEWSELTDISNTPSNHSDLNNISSDDHHSRYTDSEAVDAVKGAVANPGYAIYFTNTDQKKTPGYVSFDNGAKDSYNTDGRISQPHNNRISLQAGYYIISYLATFHEEGSTPDVWARIYDRTNGSSLYWTQTRHELWDGHQRCTISFSFPWYISSQTDISLQVHTSVSSTQPAKMTQATLAVHAVY